MKESQLKALDKKDGRLIQLGLNQALPGRKPLVIDGDVGRKTVAAYNAYVGKTPQATATVMDEGEFDQRTERNISSLLPGVQPVFRQYVSQAKVHCGAAGLTYKVISGTRTWDEQNALYAEGRTKPGRKVTNARGGYSNHNFGVAVDGAIFKGSAYLDGSSSSSERKLAGRMQRELGTIAKRLGLKWGGDWNSFNDPPHIEFPTGYTLAQMRQRVRAGKAIV